MQMFDQQHGIRHVFPDDVDPQQAQGAMVGFGQQQQQRQQWMGGLSGIGQMIAQSMPINQPIRHAPISPGAAMAMTPDAMNQTLTREHQTNEAAAQREHMAQQQQKDRSVRQQHIEMQHRQMIAHELQREKDRAQQIALEDQRNKNREKIERMRQREREKQEQARDQRPQLHTPTGTQYHRTEEGWRAEPVPGAPTQQQPMPRGAAPAGAPTAQQPTQQRALGALQGYERGIISPDGQQGWVHRDSGHILSDDQYQERASVEQAWGDRVWDGQRQQFYQENAITGERRYPGSPQDTAAGSPEQQQRQQDRQRWIEQQMPPHTPPEQYFQEAARLGAIWDEHNQAPLSFSPTPAGYSDPEELPRPYYGMIMDNHRFVGDVNDPYSWDDPNSWEPI